MFDVKLAGDTLRALAIAAGNDHHARAHAIAKARNLGSASKAGADDANTDSLICFHRSVVIPEQAYSAALCPQMPQRGAKSTQVFFKSFALFVLSCGPARPKADF